MKKFMLFIFSLLVFVGVAGSVHAERLYSTPLPFFSDGLDLLTGDTLQDPTILIITFTDDEIEQLLKPAVANLADFSEHPEIDLTLEYDPGAVNPLVLTPEHLLEIAVLKDTSMDLLGSETLASLIFRTYHPGESVAFSANDLLFFKTDASNLLAMQVSHTGGLESPEVSVYAAPEPSALVLMGLGLIGLFGIGLRREQKRK